MELDTQGSLSRINLTRKLIGKPILFLSVMLCISSIPVLASFILDMKIFFYYPKWYDLITGYSVVCCFFAVYYLIWYCFNAISASKEQLKIIGISYVLIVLCFANMYYLFSFTSDMDIARHDFSVYYNRLIKKDSNNFAPDPFLTGDGFKNKLWRFRDKLNVESPPQNDSVEEIKDWIIGSVFEPLPKLPNYIDCIYFSGITIATVGYGDIRPVTSLGKILSLVEAFIGQLIFIFAIGKCFAKWK